MRLTAFTLIELLVVISIIAVLAGMTMGAVTMVRASAKATACLGQQRQLGLGVMAYSQDWEGFLVQQQLNGVNTRWRVEIAQYLDIPVSAFNDPILAKGIFRCPAYQDNPALVNAYDQSGYSWNVSELGLGFNSTGSASVAVTLSQVGSPSGTIGIGDTSDDPVVSGSPTDYVKLQKPSYTSRQNSPVGSRHRNGINTWWVDGHASFSPRATLMAGQGGSIDWFYLRDKP